MLTIIKGPYLQWPTKQSMTIMWETSEASNARVEVLAAERIHSGYQGNYKPPQAIIAHAAEVAYTRIHKLTIHDLAPGTLYFYKVYSENEQGAAEAGPHPMKTAVDNGQPFSFTVTSETGGYSGFDQSNGQINTKIFNQMERYRPDFALFIGDIVNDGQEYEDWSKYFFEPGKNLLTCTPSYSCLGNHEKNASWYYDFFSFPPPSRYYSFDYGDAHFICLDSTDFIPSETYPLSANRMHPGHPQYDFLIQDLQRTRAKWKIVYFHYPPYISGGYQVDALRELCPILEQYGVDLVLNSHTIVYERSHPLRENRIDYDQGIVYIVAGGAGAMPGWLLPKREWHTYQSLAVPHFLQVVVSENHLRIYAVDEDGSCFDSLMIRKYSEHNEFY